MSELGTLLPLPLLLIPLQQQHRIDQPAANYTAPRRCSQSVWESFATNNQCTRLNKNPRWWADAWYIQQPNTITQVRRQADS